MHRTRDLIQKGARKRKEVFVRSEKRFFFPERGGLFFFDFQCELFKRLHCTVDTCSVVFNYHARLRNFAREKNVGKSFRSFVSFFFLTPSPFGASRMTARNSFHTQKFVKLFLCEKQTTPTLK